MNKNKKRNQAKMANLFIRWIKSAKGAESSISAQFWCPKAEGNHNNQTVIMGYEIGHVMDEGRS